MITAALVMVIATTAGAVEAVERSLANPADPPAATSQPDRTPPQWGLASPGLPGDFTALKATVAAVGRTPKRVTWYSAWAWGTGFDAAAAAQVAAMGAVPVVTWEPWDPRVGVDQSTFSLQSIAAGAHDRYIHEWADEIAAYSQPVVIRFAHEMNGEGWYPWQGDPGDYVAAYRHVVGIFRAAGASNAVFEWCPNVVGPDAASLGAFYPGDDYVDDIGLDGYARLTDERSAAQIFGPSLAEAQAIAPGEPVYIGETGAPEDPSKTTFKADWITAMFSWLQTTNIRGVTWFDFDKTEDDRIGSSPTSQAAMKAGLMSL